MKSKKLLLLAVLPLMLASCGSAEFNMYDQNIHYDAPIYAWDGTSSTTGETARKIFTDNFSKIDWEKSSPVAKHDTAEVAIQSVNDTVATNFKAKYGNYKITTGSKGSNPKVCGATLTLDGKTYAQLHFTIKEGEQTEFVFLNDKEVDVASIKITKTYNHSISNSILSIGSDTCGIRYTFVFTEEIPSYGKSIHLDFYANFAS